MRTITAAKVTAAVKALCLKANLELRSDVLRALESSRSAEKGRSRKCVEAIIANARAARAKRLPICQDTGLPAVFLEVGQDCRVAGDLYAAVNKGVAQGYAAGSFRKSIVSDPVKRGSPGFTPAVIHTDIVKGGRIRISVLPKGFGCENKTKLRMLNPTAGPGEIRKFVVEAVREAGVDACPPYVVGVGIGGTAELACLMAKKALLGKPGKGKLEKELLREINRLAIGPFGLGGKTTCLWVAVRGFPTHIAGLPVAVSISCHALRSASAAI